MQLDQTHVVIRVRTLSEIGDLALTMIRRYPEAFFQVFFIGALPWIVLNTAALGWIPWQVGQDQLFDDQSVADLLRYAYWLATLVIVQVPLAGAFCTVYLGQAVFESRPTLGLAWREVRDHFWSLTWALGIWRLALPLMLVPLFRIGQEASLWWDFWVPTFALLWVAVQRSGRPFLPEMLLLEQCPIRSKDEAVVTLKRRSASLHGPITSELSSRFLTVSFVYLVLAASLYMSMIFLRGLLVGTWASDAYTWLIFYPLALWLIGSFSVLVRLLGYLDSRIRLEGWEVELAVRAEAIRQFGEDATTARRATTMDDQPPTSDDETSSVPPPAESGVPSDDGGRRDAARQSGVKSGTVVSSVILAIVLAMNSASIASADGVTIRMASPESPSFSSSSVFEVAGTTPEAYLDDSAWYDASEQTLRPVPVEERNVDASHRSSRWSAAPAPKKKTTTSASSRSGNSSWGRTIGWIILILAAISVAALIAWLLQYTDFNFGRPEEDLVAMSRGDQLDEQTRQRIEELPPELRQEEGHPRAIAERWMKEGNFDRAIVALFGHQLLLLDRAGWLRLSRGKTNRRYVMEARRQQPEAGDLLADTVEAFEYVYFGRHSLDAENFNRLWRQNGRLEWQVGSMSEQAA